MMVYTAVMVPMTDFLTGVLSALVLYWALKGAFAVLSVRPTEEVERAGEPVENYPEPVGIEPAGGRSH
jgi:hypothetical protein